jgi:hypothetical protein
MPHRLMMVLKLTAAYKTAMRRKAEKGQKRPNKKKKIQERERGRGEREREREREREI